MNITSKTVFKHKTRLFTLSDTVSRNMFGQVQAASDVTTYYKVQGMNLSLTTISYRDKIQVSLVLDTVYVTPKLQHIGLQDAFAN